MYRSSRLRSTLNTNVITGLDMFQVCTEAVDCVALWTRTSSQVWTCFKYDPKIRKTKHFFSQVWTCVTSLTKTKTLLPVGRMLSLGPWPRVLPKPYETMFYMHKNKRLLWGVHDQKRARPRTRKKQPGALFCSHGDGYQTFPNKLITHQLHWLKRGCKWKCSSTLLPSWARMKWSGCPWSAEERIPELTFGKSGGIWFCIVWFPPKWVM